MSETPQLTVPTAFNDISQLAEGMSDRVDEERLMLYGPDPVDDNSWIRFSVLLMDQSVALAGVGRAVASIDGGEERPEVARFDIVLDNLQFEGTSEVVYERMLVYRSQAFSEGPGTGEVSREEVDAAEAALADDDFEGDDATMVASAEEYAEHVQATADEEPAAAEAYAEPAPEEAYAEPAPEEYAEPAAEEAYAEVAPEEGLPDFAEDMGEVATVVGETPSEQVVADAYDEGGYEEPAASEFDAVQDDVVDDYQPAATNAESFADVQTEDIEGPADWGTSEIDVSQVDEVVEGDVPPSAAPPAPPAAPAGFSIETTDRALTRASRGATWEPNLALAPEPRAPSGLFPYASGLPVPEHAPRPDLDPSYHIQPAPRPVEASGDSTDLESAAVQDDSGYDEGGYEEAQAVEDVEDVSAEAAPVDVGELSYDDAYAEPDDAAAFDDASTEIVEDSEAYEDSEATRMDLEAPDDPQ